MFDSSSTNRIGSSFLQRQLACLRRGGRGWSAPQVHVWTVKNGKATAFWEYEGDQQGDGEFWSSNG